MRIKIFGPAVFVPLVCAVLAGCGTQNANESTIGLLAIQDSSASSTGAVSETSLSMMMNDGNGSSSISLNDVSHKMSGFVRKGLPDGRDPFSGPVWFDYDKDKDLDLFVSNVQGENNSLWRNNGDGTFTDVAVAAGVANGNGNAGAVAGDIDNDGCQDLFATGEGGVMATLVQTPVTLYHNNCDGTFTDISATSGIVGTPSSWAPAMADIDNDGDLDLFITSVGSLSVHVQHKNQLFLNNGDLTFTDISASAGIDTALGACVAAFTDYDNDGYQDVVVGNCNDVTIAPTPMELFRNNGDNTFTDVAQQAGITQLGYWMAMTIGDYDSDGDQDIFATSSSTIEGAFQLTPSPHVLYENNGDGTYTDVAAAAGVDHWEFSWGATFTDFDNDGYNDILFTGALPPDPPFGAIGPGKANPGRLLLNNGDKTFRMHQEFGLENEFSGGLAAADYNKDGYPDAVITTSTWAVPGRIVLLENSGGSNNWVQLRLKGKGASNKDAIGAQIKLKSGNDMVREVRAGHSLFSMDSLWQTFGLGNSNKKKVKVRVKWPSGKIEEFKVKTRKLNKLKEGKGKKKNHF